MKYDPEKLLFAVDLAGTLLFAIEGATAAISGNLDVLGLMVLAFATPEVEELFATCPDRRRPAEFTARLALLSGGIYGRGHRFLPASFRSRYSEWSHDCSRRSGIGAVRRRWDAKGVDLQNASFHYDSAGDNHWSGWRDDPRHIPGANTYSLARRCLCHRGHGRIGRDDRGAKAGTASYPVCHPGRCSLFWAASGQRLAALESAEGRRLSSSRSHHETVMRRSYFWGGASSAITTCAFGVAA